MLVSDALVQKMGKADLPGSLLMKTPLFGEGLA